MKRLLPLLSILIGLVGCGRYDYQLISRKELAGLRSQAEALRELQKRYSTAQELEGKRFKVVKEGHYEIVWDNDRVTLSNLDTPYACVLAAPRSQWKDLRFL